MNHTGREGDRLRRVRLVSRQNPEANPRRLQLPNGNENVGGKIVLDGDGAFESLVGFQLTLQRFWNRGSGVACAEAFAPSSRTPSRKDAFQRRRAFDTLDDCCGR